MQFICLYSATVMNKHAKNQNYYQPFSTILRDVGLKNQLKGNAVVNSTLKV